jgi:membrane associated rhomboid family serine protease
VFEIWQLVSYSFLHGSVMHLLLNMYALWLFGSRMENVWGSRSFTFYYFVCVIGAGLVQLFIATQGAHEGGIYPTIGASGGVFGLLLGFGLTFPNERLLLIFPPVALQAKWFVLIYGVIELWAGVTGTQAGVAHFAHLGGMLFGFLLLLYWGRHPPGNS